MAFPGTNSFVGEFLILVGSFTANKLVASFAIPGAILAAAYMLRLLQKVIWGGTDNPGHQGLFDLSVREIVILAPLLVFVFWIGLSPAPFLAVMHSSVSHLVAQVSAQAPAAQSLAANMLP